MLFGDATAGESGGLIAVAMAAGGGIGWFLNWWSNRDKDKRKEQLEDAARDKARSDELYERMKMDRNEAVKREGLAQAAYDYIRSQMTEVRIRSEKKSGHIEYCEFLLDQHQIVYRKWQEDPHGVPHDPEPEHDK